MNYFLLSTLVYKVGNRGGPRRCSSQSPTYSRCTRAFCIKQLLRDVDRDLVSAVDKLYKERRNQGYTTSNTDTVSKLLYYIITESISLQNTIASQFPLISASGMLSLSLSHFGITQD